MFLILQADMLFHAMEQEKRYKKRESLKSLQEHHKKMMAAKKHREIEVCKILHFIIPLFFIAEPWHHSSTISNLLKDFVNYHRLIFWGFYIHFQWGIMLLSTHVDCSIYLCWFGSVYVAVEPAITFGGDAFLENSVL